MKKENEFTGMKPTRCERRRHVVCSILSPIMVAVLIYALMLAARGWAAALIIMAAAMIVLSAAASWDSSYREKYDKDYRDEGYTGDDLYE